jgi:predicted CXXCH cytochrome family protein
MAPNEHTVDVIPSMDVGGLPLKEGKVTCVTCHDPHKNPYSMLLRVPAKDLCLVCHKK